MSTEEGRSRDEKEEKERGGFDEKWRRDPIDAAGWAVFLIWIGVVLLAEHFGYLARFERLETWSVIITGAGVLVLLQVLLRLAIPAYRKPVLGSIIFGLMLMAGGLSQIVELNWPVFGALALIIIGGGMLVGGLIRGGRP
jgi:hypothetical protein